MSRTRIALLAASIAALAATGCTRNAGRDDALAKAQAAHARGDLVGEALALRDACGFAKDDKDLCKRASQAWIAAQGAVRQGAERACSTLETAPQTVDTCLAAIGEVRRMSPGDPEVAALAARAGKQHAAHCLAEAPAWQTTIEDGLELIRCEDARVAQIDVPEYTALIAQARASTRDQLIALLHKPDVASRHGATAELLGAAVCLAPTPDLGQQAAAARATFADRARASIDLHATTTTPLPDLCGVIASALGGRAMCGPARDGAPQLTVVGDITIQPVEHSAFDTTESVEYVAGIIQFANPEYQPAVSAEQSARSARDQADTQYRRDKSDCDSAEHSLSSVSSTCNSDCPEKRERDRACNLAQTSESEKSRRESEYDSARNHLSNTKPIEERKDIRTATYSVRHHSWRASWRAHLRNDGKPIEIGGDTSASDLETSGAPVAGVQRDPLTPPGDRWFVPAIRDQVGANLAQILDGSLRRRASDLATSCSGGLTWTPDYLECWARSHFWTATGAPPDALLRAATDASDQKKGAAWPPLACAAP